VRQSIQFTHERPVGRIDTLSDSCCESSGTRALEMCQE
jgi:hypothetical protein